MSSSELSFSHIDGKRPVLVLEGHTDRIFLDRLWRSRGLTEPDFLVSGGKSELATAVRGLAKSSMFLTIPALLILADSDGQTATTLAQIGASLGLEAGHGEVKKLERAAVPGASLAAVDSIFVGGFLFENDLEDVISHSTRPKIQEEVRREALSWRGEQPRDHMSKRTRLLERASSGKELSEITHHSLYGGPSDIDFDSVAFDDLVTFLQKVPNADSGGG